ncbi:MAG: helix-turn-helix domain-containing protein, partial [Patescibacteria group bacterium]
RKSQKTVKGARANITPWLDFFFAMVLKHSQVAVDLLSQENIEKILSPKQLSVWSYLQSVEQTTPREIVLHTKIARPTVNQALEVLLRLKKIERMGLGRSTRYKARIA